MIELTVPVKSDVHFDGNYLGWVDVYKVTIDEYGNSFLTCCLRDTVKELADLLIPKRLKPQIGVGELVSVLVSEYAKTLLMFGGPFPKKLLRSESAMLDFDRDNESILALPNPAIAFRLFPYVDRTGVRRWFEAEGLNQPANIPDDHAVED